MISKTLTSKDPWVGGTLNGRKAFAGPEHVTIDLTNRCNQRCLGCWTKSPLLRDRAPGPDWHDDELDYKIVSQLIRDLGRMLTKIIRFTGGGEPFMYHRLMELIHQVKSSRMRACLTTNMSLVSRQRVLELLEAGIDELAVSIWAADAEVYRQLHPDVPSPERTFQKIVSRLREICDVRNNGPRVTISNVILNLNYHQLTEMVELAGRIGVDSVYFAVLDPVPGRTDCLLLSREQRRSCLDQLDRVEKEYPSILENADDFRRRLSNSDADIGKYDSVAVNSMPCYVGWIFCRIMANGDVVPCCRAVKMVMGNLKEQSFGDIWHSNRYGEFRYNAKELPKEHAYFAPIGCNTTCDNLVHNRHMHERIRSLAPCPTIDRGRIRD